MDSLSPCLMVLCGKSFSEKELAKCLKDSNTLKLPEDTAVSILLHSETEQAFDAESFHINSFFNSLSTTCFGRLLIWSPRLQSTHDIVSQNFCELPVGAACVADVQFKGRGRLKNVWESPKGCLMFSFTIQMDDGRAVPLLQYVVSLAMTEAIKDICCKNLRHGLPGNCRLVEMKQIFAHKIGVPRVDVRIKWPNDLYLNGLKVGGILCTSTYKSKKFNVSAGIGLNIDNEKPTTCLNAVLQKYTSTDSQLKREEILAAFFNKFENLFDLFVKRGFQCLEELYYNTWLHSGQRVSVQEKNENQSLDKVVTIQGLTSSGFLLAVDEDGQMCELHPDGNSFDFFKGLVKRKPTN